ncbi:MAG: hypothetical protein M3144_04065 [Actinomycetota bacterium]|nr:hypothetical protein [Actinomycetota bacterium]
MATQRRWAVGGFVTAAAVLLASAGSHACVFGPSVFLSPAKVKAGESVQVEGLYFRRDVPVVARFTSLDGPTLTEFGLPQGDRQMVTGPITIPNGTPPGDHIIVFTQPGPTGAPAQVPARALVTVLGSGGSDPVIGRQVGQANDVRTSALATEDDAGIGTGLLLLVGLGVAGATLLVAGGVTLAASRRRPAREAEKVTA